MRGGALLEAGLRLNIPLHAAFAGLRGVRWLGQPDVLARLVLHADAVEALQARRRAWAEVEWALA